MGDSAIRYQKYDGDYHRFFVYVLRLKNGRYYVGQTRIICRRILDHFSGRGAVITKKYPPEKIVCIGVYPTRREAIRRENELTNLYPFGIRRTKKLQILEWRRQLRKRQSGVGDGHASEA